MTFTHGYALVIGIGSYQYHPLALNVPQTAADAQAVGAVLRDPQACGYPPHQVTVLHDSSATRQGILTALKHLSQQTTPADTVLLFYSGHGEFAEDGTTYTLTTHDTRLTQAQDAQGNPVARVVADTGISHTELLAQLRSIHAGRLFLFFNACFSGSVSPTLSAETPLAPGHSLPEQTAYAILSTGTGRAIITAAREQQYSFLGSGNLTIFAQALVDGLRGTQLPNREGAITLFDLYAVLYAQVTAQTISLVPTLTAPMRAKHRGDCQQPELTLLKNTGVLTVALHPGTTAPTPLASGSVLSPDIPRREVDSTTSQAAFQQLVSGAGAVGVSGNLRNSPITTGSGNTITTTGDVSGISGQVAIGSGIAQASGGSQAQVITSRSVPDLRTPADEDPGRPRLSDTRLAQVIQGALLQHSLDDLLFALEGHVDLRLDRVALGDNPATQARNLVALCRSQKQRQALVESLLDIDECLLGPPDERNAWQIWARTQDGRAG